MISSIVAAMLVAVIGFGISSCSGAKARLQAEVDNFNKNEAPMDCGNGVTMTNCQLNDGSKMLVFNFTFAEPGVEVSDLAPLMGEFKKAMAQGIATEKDGKKLVELLKEAGYGMEFVIKGSRTGKDVKASFSASEVEGL